MRGEVTRGSQIFIPDIALWRSPAARFNSTSQRDASLLISHLPQVCNAEKISIHNEIHHMQSGLGTCMDERYEIESDLGSS